MKIDLGPYESPQVRAWVVAAIVAGILTVLILIAFGFQPIFGDRINPARLAPHPFPPPAVISDERAQRLALENKQRHDLAGANGHMPIGNAMRAIAAKGNHAFDPIGAAP
jgi:hypothetical protein